MAGMLQALETLSGYWLSSLHHSDVAAGRPCHAGASDRTVGLEADTSGTSPAGPPAPTQASSGWGSGGTQLANVPDPRVISSQAGARGAAW